MTSADAEKGFLESSINKLIEQQVTPNYERWEKDKKVPREFWKQLAESGMLLVDTPVEYGGSGCPSDYANVVLKSLCRGGYHGVATGLNIHANVVAPYIQHYGTEEQKNTWLPKMASAEVFGAIAMTEPSAGSDLAAMKTTAKKSGNNYVINGSKTFITNGIYADLILVCAKTDPNAGARGISLFLVDTNLPGFSRGNSISKMGQHCSDTAELFFDEVTVPKSALLGEEGRGFKYLMQELPRERLTTAACAIGHAEGALAITIDYVKERKAFKQHVSEFQNTRFKLADVRSRIVMCENLLTTFEQKLATNTLTQEDGAIIKYTSTETQLYAVNECLQLFGGYGYVDEYPISRFYRDARIQTIYAGSSEIMKEIIARGLLDS